MRRSTGIVERVRCPMPPPNPEQARWFAEEVLPHEPALRGYLRSNFPSVDPDDVVQESYLKLLKVRTAVRIASTKAYFFSIARNTALTLFRRRQIYSDTAVNELPAWRALDEGPDAAAAANARQRFELIAEAIAQLPPRCRDVVQLAVLRGRSNTQIAAELGLAENTVRVHLARGIKKCADYLRTCGERR